MTTVPAVTRQEGTQTSAPMIGVGQSVDRAEIDLYYSRCHHEGEQLIGWYKRLTVERTFAEQRAALQWAVESQPAILPKIRRLIAAVDGELSAALLTELKVQRIGRYRRALDSLSLILRQQLMG